MRLEETPKDYIYLVVTVYAACYVLKMRISHWQICVTLFETGLPLVERLLII